MVHHVGENHVHAIWMIRVTWTAMVMSMQMTSQLMHAATEICHHDVNHNGITDIDDLLDVIEGWGQPCTP